MATRTKKLATAAAPVADHQAMHAAHACWQNDNALWHEELKLWQDELAETRRELADVSAAIERHAKKLVEHGAALTLYGQEAPVHDHALAEFERGSSGQALPELAGKHQEAEQQHAAIRSVHEQLKRRHHRLVARCSLVHKAIGEK